MVVIQGVIFDMDGTLVEPAIDFAAMREAIGVLDGDILHTINSWDDTRRLEAERLIAQFEADAADKMVLMPGAVDVLNRLTQRAHRLALLTRNTATTIARMIEYTGDLFEPCLDRSFLPPKPDPAALHHILDQWSLAPQHVVMVGDTAHDLDAATAAGMPCAIIEQPYNAHLKTSARWYIQHLNELLDIV